LSLTVTTYGLDCFKNVETFFRFVQRDVDSDLFHSLHSEGIQTLGCDSGTQRLKLVASDMA
jgi:hypothetical protein